MSLDKAIASGKEKRKPYRGAKAVDSTCRNHGSCKRCESDRRHKMRDKLDSISTEEDLFPELTDEEKAKKQGNREQLSVSYLHLVTAVFDRWETVLRL